MTTTWKEQCQIYSPAHAADCNVSMVKQGTQYSSAQSKKGVFTFDVHQHEVLVRHSAVVGHLLGDVDAAQVDTAEVLLAGHLIYLFAVVVVSKTGFFFIKLQFSGMSISWHNVN